MFSASFSADLARARHCELLDQAARRRLVRDAQRARRSTRPGWRGKLARLTRRSAPKTSDPSAHLCDPPAMPVSDPDGSPPPRATDKPIYASQDPLSGRT
jgi:hypothetical protein